MQSIENSLVSVVIPVVPGSHSLGQCLEKVVRQDFPNKEVIVVCAPGAADAASLPTRTKGVRVIREREPSTLARLVDSGMRTARGQFRILLMPHCVPVGDGWMRNMVAPFEDEQVGAVVSQCYELDRSEPGLAARLLDTIDPRQRRSPGKSPGREQVVSYLCDAYRASVAANVDYLALEGLTASGQAIALSIKTAEAGYSIVLSDDAVAGYNAPEDRRRLGKVMAKALDYGRTDALLDRLHNLCWLNSGVLAAALLSLPLLPVAVLSLPAAVIVSIALFIWGWFLSLRVPLLRWECPAAIANFIAYAAVVLTIRGGWWPELFGREMHPAIIRQWCWLGALTGSYLLLIAYTCVRGAARALRRPRGWVYALPVLLLGVPWWLLAGVGYLRGRLVRRPRAG